MYPCALLLAFFLQLAPVLSQCECGFRLSDTHDFFSHFLYNDFSTYENAQELHMSLEGKRFRADWAVQSYPKPRASGHPIDYRFDDHNVWIEDGLLKMRQNGYTREDAEADNGVIGASIVSTESAIFHGSFRTTMEILGATGGSVVSLFFYRVRNSVGLLTASTMANVSKGRQE